MGPNRLITTTFDGNCSDSCVYGVISADMSREVVKEHDTNLLIVAVM